MSPKPWDDGWSEWGCVMTQVGHAAYLAVDTSQDVHTCQIKDYSNEGGHTCEGVYLYRDGGGRVEKSGAAGKRRNAREAHITTDPYRLLVRTMSSEDIPLVVKSGEELPTGCGGFNVRETLVERNADSGRTHRYRPSTACQNFTRAPLKRYSQSSKTTSKERTYKNRTF